MTEKLGREPLGILPSITIITRDLDFAFPFHKYFSLEIKLEIFITLCSTNFFVLYKFSIGAAMLKNYLKGKNFRGNLILWLAKINFFTEFNLAVEEFI